MRKFRLFAHLSSAGTLARLSQLAYRCLVPLPLLFLLGVLCVASSAQAQSAVPPKVALLIAGDPDEPLREAAESLGAELTASGLRQPSDPALRAALLGVLPESADGLHAVRAMRRGLGLDPKEDLEAYRRLGRIAGADALLVLQRRGSRTSCEVFDVAAGQFYEGVLDLGESSSEERIAFVRSRAIEAQARWAEQPDETKASAAAAAAGLPPTEQDEPTGTDEESRAKRRIKKAWPWILAGGLLAAAVTYIVIDQSGDDGQQLPVLVFRPGQASSEAP
jgi:hypothetical protein